MTQVTTPGALIGVMTGYQDAAVVAAACRLGFPDVVGPTPVTATTVAEALGLAVRPTATVLRCLATLGLVHEVHGDQVTYTAGVLLPRLGRDGDLAAIVAKEAFFARLWTDLDTTVRTGSALLDPWRERVATDPAGARAFLQALVTIAEVAGADVIGSLQAAGIADADTEVPLAGRTVVDLGGGLGSYAVPLARAGADVVLLDLPEVVGWASDRLAGLDCAPGRVIPVSINDWQGGRGTGQPVGADVNAGAGADVSAAAVIPTGPEPATRPGAPRDSAGAGRGDTVQPDAVLVSHLLHDVDDTEAAMLLRSAAAMTRPGGVVVVVEIPGDEAGIGPLFDLMMQIETGGSARPLADLVAMVAAEVGPVTVDRSRAPVVVVRGVVT